MHKLNALLSRVVISYLVSHNDCTKAEESDLVGMNYDCRSYNP